MSKVASVLLAVAVMFIAVPSAFAAPLAQEGDAPEIVSIILMFLMPIGSGVALFFAYQLYQDVMKRSEGTERMVEIAEAVRQGARAYLNRQNTVVGSVIVVLTIILAIMAYFGLHNVLVPIAFLFSGLFSALCGYLGMQMATNASARTANGARESLNEGLQVAFRGGAVMGLCVVGFALLDTTIWFFGMYFAGYELSDITAVLISAAMGASTQALFARVGGGIYTKAADVGADLVGKVEAGIPEDDPRNPATIADNVGDNVGDVAGMGADLYESYLGSIRATAALGVAAAATTAQAFSLLVAPMIIAGAGVLVSVWGIYQVKTKDDASMKEVMHALTSRIDLVSVIVAAVSAVLILILGLPWQLIIPVIAGLAVGVAIGYVTEYYTSDTYSPTQNLAAQGTTGPATVIIGGIGLGLRSTGLPVVLVIVGIALSFYVPGGADNAFLGLYGVGLAAVSMLSTLGITLATDAYGPIADNAGGNAEMAELPPEVRERTDQLDAVGNTTAATGKGFAIGSAALTALALLASYMEQVQFSLGLQGVTELGDFAIEDATLAQFVAYYDVTLLNPATLLGVFAGAVTVCYFSAMTMDAVGRAAGAMVDEVRRQFKEKPGILQGTEKPDYALCVDISTIGAQREMIAPSVLAIIVPVIIGVLFGVAGVLGLLAGGLTTGFVIAVMMSNAGGAWDNAKKFVEKGSHGGKNSEVHKATVVGDTVGDPFKDTTGPSLNILIKLMSMVSIVFSGLIVLFDNGNGLLGLITGG